MTWISPILNPPSDAQRSAVTIALAYGSSLKPDPSLDSDGARLVDEEPRLSRELCADQNSVGKIGMLIGQIRHQDLDLVAISAHAEAQVGDGVARVAQRVGYAVSTMVYVLTGGVPWRVAEVGEIIGAPPDERGGNRHTEPTATAPHLDSIVTVRKTP